MEDVEVRDTVSEEHLVKDVLRELMGHIYNRITVSELCKILKDNFDILSRYCCDFIQRLIIELDMYCPDRKHPYFVEGNKQVA
ncbi:hypothetical protein [Methanolobus halotolerans]|uniref:hypothetical protein n=1 Tax=Methanolobus halotolerans TaxID=2052935 RepID=UPI001F2900A2|nr:hypothetical protein [Methanolobus halotolerans]